MTSQQWLAAFCFLNRPNRVDLESASASSDHNTFRLVLTSIALFTPPHQRPSANFLLRLPILIELSVSRRMHA
nr:unnamed protein product [Callosobruchus chinensis]